MMFCPAVGTIPTSSWEAMGGSRAGEVEEHGAVCL